MGRGTQTTHSQRLAIVTWLKKPSNFNLITGKAVSTTTSVVAGKKLRKADAYADLAVYVNSTTASHWSKEQCKSR